jgi:hypothetical protein
VCDPVPARFQIGSEDSDVFTLVDFDNRVSRGMYEQAIALAVRPHLRRTHYSAHISDTPSMYKYAPIPAASGGYLADGDPYRPEGVTNIAAR